MSSAEQRAVRAARPGDYQTVRELLNTSSLPLDGVPDSLTGFVVAEEDGRVIAVAGVEDCGRYGLLRSAAVDPAARNRGIGRRLVERLVTDAKEAGRETLYLLTTTAEDYFASFGFVKTSRDSVPSSIRSTREFTHVCPASATVMKLDLA